MEGRAFYGGVTVVLLLFGWFEADQSCIVGVLSVQRVSSVYAVTLNYGGLKEKRRVDLHFRYESVLLEF